MRFQAFRQGGPIPAAPGDQSWEKLMDLALQEARTAAAAGEVPVGAVIIDPHGAILATAHNRVELDNDPSAHAEILAIRKACAKTRNCRLPDCVLLATLEPCLMCAGAIMRARLAGIVYGAYDSEAGCVSSNLDWLDLPGHDGIWQMGGVRAVESAGLLRDFFAEKRWKRHFGTCAGKTDPD